MHASCRASASQQQSNSTRRQAVRARRPRASRYHGATDGFPVASDADSGRDGAAGAPGEKTGTAAGRTAGSARPPGRVHSRLHRELRLQFGGNRATARPDQGDGTGRTRGQVAGFVQGRGNLGSGYAGIPGGVRGVLDGGGIGLTANTFNNPDTLHYGSPYATFLLGALDGSSQMIGGPVPDPHVRFYGMYIQDDWKLSPKVTLNLGLRDEYETALYDPQQIGR